MAATPANPAKKTPAKKAARKAVVPAKRTAAKPATDPVDPVEQAYNQRVADCERQAALVRRHQTALVKAKASRDEAIAELRTMERQRDALGKALKAPRPAASATTVSLSDLLKPASSKSAHQPATWLRGLFKFDD